MSKKRKDEDLWNLDITIAKFILPKLIKFKEKTFCFPCSLNDVKEWHKILDKMIYSFSMIKNTFKEDGFYSNEEIKKIDQGLRLFAKYYHDLWW